MTSLAGQNVRDGEGLPLREAVEITKALLSPSASDTNAYKRAAIWQVGHCVTKRAQGLRLAIFRSLGVAVLRPVVEGHQPILYPNEGHLESVYYSWMNTKAMAEDCEGKGYLFQVSVPRTSLSVAFSMCGRAYSSREDLSYTSGSLKFQCQ